MSIVDAIYEMEAGLIGLHSALTKAESALLRIKLEQSAVIADKRYPIEALKKLRHDLDWRGPDDKRAGTICLPRLMADQLMEWIDEQQRVVRSREGAAARERQVIIDKNSDDREMMCQLFDIADRIATALERIADNLEPK